MYYPWIEELFVTVDKISFHRVRSLPSLCRKIDLRRNQIPVVEELLSPSIIFCGFHWRTKEFTLLSSINQPVGPLNSSDLMDRPGQKEFMDIASSTLTRKMGCLDEREQRLQTVTL